MTNPAFDIEYLMKRLHTHSCEFVEEEAILAATEEMLAQAGVPIDPDTGNMSNGEVAKMLKLSNREMKRLLQGKKELTVRMLAAVAYETGAKLVIEFIEDP